MNGDLQDFLRRRQTLVDVRLDALLAPRAGQPENLREAMRYSLLAGGKRLRPLLTVLACECGGGEAEAALDAGCAVEMVHTYSLVHDDLPAMDDDDLRRGMPTCHKKFGEALAILAGDALLTLAFEVLASSYSPAVAAGCCKELATGAGAAGMVGGQVVDLALSRAEPGNHASVSLADLESLHARKTGALFRAALRLGAWVAQGERPGGPEPLLLHRLDEYGRCFGLAFQITDDLLDVEGSADRTGKRVQKDAGRGKLTYPGFLGLEESRRQAETLCQQACALVQPLGLAGQRLAQLARFVVQRDH